MLEISRELVVASLNADDDYELQPSPQVITIPESSNGARFCVTVNTTRDADFEGDEQFELYFENLPSDFAGVGDIDTVCVTIEDPGNSPSNIDSS